MNNKKKLECIDCSVREVSDEYENRLYRPEIDFKKAMYLFLGVVCGSIVLAFIVVFFLNIFSLEWTDGNLFYRFLEVYLFTILGIFAFTCKYIIIWLVKVYQSCAKAETRLRCCYTPSCSEYCILAVKKYGAIIGGIKTINRLLRCTPPGGIDYP